MSTIDIFSRIELPKEEVFKYLSNSHTIARCASPFFKLENLRCKNSKIDQDTHFTQKNVFFDFLQLFFRVKEVIPPKKISYQFDGLIKGMQVVDIIEDEGSSLIKERLEFSLYNQFNIPLLDIFLSLFFYIDTFIRHLRLKSILYKESEVDKKKLNIFKELSTIRSYIVIDARISDIESLFEDLNKFSLWLSPFLKLQTLNTHDFKEGQEFSLKFIFPFLPCFYCRINKKSLNKIEISFSNPLLRGNNSWSIIPYENQFVIENTVEIEEIMFCLELLWLVLGNTLIRDELNNWNKRLKEVAEKTNLSKYLDLAVSGL